MRQINIPPVASPTITEQVLARWNSLTKPPGSLGRLEELVLQLALQQGTARPQAMHKALYVFCADHGITAEGVSPYPSAVTRQMLLNFVGGGAAISVLCRHSGIEPIIIDAGVMGAPVEGTRNLKIGLGTRNFAVEPAMTREQALRALTEGTALANERDDHLRGVGEMGIGNTTSASALLCAFTGLTPEQAAGPGTGLSPAGVSQKAAVIARALALYRPDPSDPIAVLSQLGGFEIAMMAGFLLGSAERRIPVVLDGFITGAAALVAQALAPQVTDYFFFAHQSAEPGHAYVLQALRGTPLLQLDMRLGEGSGAALGMGLISQALALYDGMATFEEAAVSNRESSR